MIEILLWFLMKTVLLVIIFLLCWFMRIQNNITPAMSAIYMTSCHKFNSLTCWYCSQLIFVPISIEKSIIPCSCSSSFGPPTLLYTHYILYLAYSLATVVTLTYTRFSRPMCQISFLFPLVRFYWRISPIARLLWMVRNVVLCLQLVVSTLPNAETGG
jgi:hypothetical protein